MKLADKYIPEKLPNNHFFDFFKADLQKVIYAITPDLSSRQMRFSNQGAVDYNVERDFFETTYIPIFSVTNLNFNDLPNPKNCILPEELKKKLGLKEREILTFVYNGEDAHRLVITGKKGWGKTTLLRFLSAYAIPELNKTNQNKICNSLYISFNTKQVDNDFTKEKFDTILLNEIRKFCENKINDDILSSFYQYLLNKSDLSKEKIKYNDIIRDLDSDIITSKEAFIRLSQLRKEILEQKDELVVLTCLEHFNYDPEHPIIPLLILDDLDPFPTQLQVHVYRKIYELAHDYKVKVILAMRPRSYDCVVDHTLETIPTYTIVSLDKPNFEKYLLSKLKKVETMYQKGVPVSGNMIFSVEDMKNFFSYYTDVLTQKDTMEFLVRLSDGDLRVFNSLLETFLSSGYIKESELIYKMSIRKDNLQEAETQKKELKLLPIWIVYTSIITNNHQTVFGLRHNDPRSHMMNVFCNGKGEVNTHLIRFHLLSYFLRLKSAPTTIKEIYKSYSKLTDKWDNEGLLKSIRRVIGRFAKARMIGNNQRLVLAGMEFRSIEKYDEESFYLEENLGKLYFYDLLKIYEYFLYMKDDVDLEDNKFDIKDCIEIQHRYERFEEVVKYLKFLFDKEKQFFTDLLPEKRTIYKSNYAPVSGEIMYSNLFVKTMTDYAASRKSILERRKETDTESNSEHTSIDYTEKDLEKLQTVLDTLHRLHNEITSYISCLEQ